MARQQKRYGITSRGVEIKGLDAALKQLDALPETIARGAQNGIKRVLDNVQMRAKANIMSEDHSIANAIEVETTISGQKVKGTIYVGTGPYGAVPMPVFVEMGTGPEGIASTSGPAGQKYPLPASAYTQEPWWFYDEEGKHTHDGKPGLVFSHGMPANPYLWPAILAEQPFAKDVIIDAINKEIRKLKGGGA